MDGGGGDVGAASYTIISFISCAAFHLRKTSQNAIFLAYFPQNIYNVSGSI